MKQYEIVYTGACLSLNNVKSQHWRKTEKQKNDIKARVKVLLVLAKVSFMKRYRIAMLYNSRHDLINVAFMIKIIEDCCKTKGYIIDDTKKFCRGILIEPDETLPTNTFKFIITETN